MIEADKRHLRHETLRRILGPMKVSEQEALMAGIVSSHLTIRMGSIQMLQRAAIMVAVFIGVSACNVENRSQREATTNSTQWTGAGDPAAGFAYAKENCASCHAIERGEIRSPNPAAPTFESLANRPDMTRMTLSALLRMPHRNMPNLVVEPDRIDDVSAYLSTLRRDQEPL